VQALSQRGRPFVALVEALPEAGLTEYLLTVRSRGGGKFYPAGFRGVRECMAMLQEGGVVALVADRDIHGTGVPAMFFGRCVKFPKGPWEMARRTGATVLPMFSARRGLDDMTVFVEEPFTVSKEGEAEVVIRKAVQHWADMLERNIRREPGQWSVLEDFFRVHACG
jgi:phosphatidylinositol dimannoside acyltransferase